MRTTLLWMLCACGALTVCGVAGCGGGDDDGFPSDAAARVGDTTIAKASVEREAKRLGATGTPSATQRQRALRRLVNDHWVRREAKARGIATAGVGTDELRKRLLAGATITDRDVIGYYGTHRADFGPPRQRITFFMRVRTVDEAARGRAGLEAGDSWVNTIAAARRRDPTIGGDALPFIEHHFRDKAFGRAMFAAAPMALVGPLRTRYGVYLFEVDNELPWSKRPPARLRPAIAAKAGPWKVDQRLLARYRRETHCADEYRVPAVPECM